MRPADTYYAVGESLQADVMRFLAIIALCLIAILALVRGAVPAQQSAAPVSPPAAAASVVVADPQPVVAPQASTASAEPESASPLRRVVGKPRPMPPVADSPQPSASAPARPDAPATAATREPATTTSADTLATPAATATPAVATEAMAAPGSDASQGLSLRFASDRDFLQLLSRGVIELFAFNGRQVLRLEDDFQFRGARTPGQVHELLPPTIPDVVASALRAPAGDYHWGVVLPPAMARQLSNHLESGATGELVIDRLGEVRHRGS